MKITIAPNPVLVKELRGQLRGPRAYIFLTGILVLLGVITYGLYQLVVSLPTGSGFTGAVIGQGIFLGLMFLCLIVICVLAPALTASAISGEHERKTIDLLLATPLSPFSILLGKLGAALSYIMLVIIATIPLVSLAFVFGGVTLSDLLGAIVVLLLLAVIYCVMGLFLSALFRRSAAALIASYVLLGLFVFGTLFMYIVVGVITRQQPPNWILALNPVCAFSSALVQLSAPELYATPSPLSSSPPAGMIAVLYVIGGGSIGSSFPLTTPLWYYSAGVYGTLTVVLFLLSGQLLKPVRRLRARTWAVIGCLGLILIVAPPVLYNGAMLARIITSPTPLPTPTPVRPLLAPPLRAPPRVVTVVIQPAPTEPPPVVTVAVQPAPSATPEK